MLWLAHAAVTAHVQDATLNLIGGISSSAVCAAGKAYQETRAFASAVFVGGGLSSGELDVSSMVSFSSEARPESLLQISGPGGPFGGPLSRY